MEELLEQIKPAHYIDRNLLANTLGTDRIRMQRFIDNYPLDAAVTMGVETNRVRYGYNYQDVHEWLKQRAETSPRVWAKYLERFEQDRALKAWVESGAPTRRAEGEPVVYYTRPALASLLDIPVWKVEALDQASPIPTSVLIGAKSRGFTADIAGQWYMSVTA